MNDKSSKDSAFKIESEEKKKETKYKPNKSYKGKKFNPKRRGSLNYNSGKKFNDVSWYKKNEGITSAYVNLPFNYIIGNKVFNSNLDGYRVPILLSYVVDWCADNGVSFNENYIPSQNKSILDLVATILYTTMRRNNSGSTNGIEYVDPIVSNLLASIDILANAVACRRVFKIANTFTWKNRMLPSIFFNHLGIDYEDFIANQATYRGRFNTIVAKARTIKTLANFNFINAICAQFENIFKDEETDTGREQLYLPMKGFHHIYSPTGTTEFPGGMVRLMKGSDIGIEPDHGGEATILTANAICDTPDGDFNPATTLPLKRKFSVDLDIMDVQISALINDADFNLLQADIEKAFGEQSGYMVIDSIPDNIEPITPIYSGENALMMKHGVFQDLRIATTDVVDINGGNITLIDKNHIVNTIYQRHDSVTGEVSLGYWYHLVGRETDIYAIPVGQYNGSSVDPDLYVHPYLNLEEDNPGEDSIILGTRYQCILASYKPQWWSRIPESFRPETLNDRVLNVGHVMSNFLLFGGIMTMLYNRSDGSVGIEHFNWSSVQLHGNTTMQMNQQRVMQGMTNFKYHPGFYTIRSIIVGELNNIRFLTRDELDSIHRSCFLSLWDLPSRTNI